MYREDLSQAEAEVEFEFSINSGLTIISWVSNLFICDDLTIADSLSKAEDSVLIKMNKIEYFDNKCSGYIPCQTILNMILINKASTNCPLQI